MALHPRDHPMSLESADDGCTGRSMTREVDRPPDLPDYEDPPVVEVAISVQFKPIREFRQGHLGLFWSEVRGEYPTAQDHPRIEGGVQTLDELEKQPAFQIEMLDSPPSNRAWFISADESLLIQVQDDRFIHNWRHRGGPYPRFDTLLEMFWKRFDTFREVLAASGLPAPQPRQAEVIYVNWVPMEDLAAFFRPATTARVEVKGVGPLPLAQTWTAQYPVSRSDVDTARLNVDCRPARQFDEGGGSRGHRLSLTFRAPVSGESREDISEFLILGRDAIVRTFTDLTTPSMHEQWKRKV